MKKNLTVTIGLLAALVGIAFIHAPTKAFAQTVTNPGIVWLAKSETATQGTNYSVGQRCASIKLSGITASKTYRLLAASTAATSTTKILWEHITQSSAVTPQADVYPFLMPAAVSFYTDDTNNPKLFLDLSTNSGAP